MIFLQLTQYGLDVTYRIDGQLRSPLTRALSDTKVKLLNNIAVKAAEEKWHLTSFKTKQQAEKLVSEFNDIGIFGTEKYITGKNIEIN